ncbi:hypothetical protein CDD81_379 [Ophiocordyceps australis]|uniref:Prolyl 4-hydroxylase alpha subunit Fe(2+) 2OG dioxygenase domain-containing protein n=1 Tax=Ophiocordyceps australis TaxID=1399860 RepID=A0A2C5XG57_9HYPO|nr:hypothetical protein CDD81_379 [Ophiocordyceps australis]
MANKLQLSTTWTTLEDQPLTKDNLDQLFFNEIPSIRQKNFLTTEECARMVKVVESATFGHYDPVLIFPLLGSIGVTQYDYAQDMDKYFEKVEPAKDLQKRFIAEAGVDIIDRVISLLQKISDVPVRLAKEGDKEYFAGILRVVENNYIAPHADFGPYDDLEREIGKVVGQVTWNILLKDVPGGETLVHDRQWQGKSDDDKWRKTAPKYAYSPFVYEGRIIKVLPQAEGELTFFNSRNFHEVRNLDEWHGKTEEHKRYTISCFVGKLPENAPGGPALILWS